jgi:peptide/nickel transport system ATP-binding protein
MTAPDTPLLILEDLSVQIRTGGGTVRTVDRVSLSVGRGRTLALVGESGSGKSMLCRAIMGILPENARMAAGARITFDGRELGSLAGRELSRLRGREIGMVLQNPLSALNPVQTIGRQLMEPMRYHLEIGASEAKTKAVELLAAVGIPQPELRLNSYPHQLSGGMRQRVTIAIALSCNPKLLIADEPTTALDVTVQAEILNLLGRLQRERNMAMLLVSHDLAVVAGRSHETAVMYAGRIVERASTKELFRRMRMPYTQALFDAIPRIDAPPHAALASIGGQPPDLTTPLTGCPFAPRCRLVRERCRQEEPPLTADGGHCCACWYPLQGRDDER